MAQKSSRKPVSFRFTKPTLPNAASLVVVLPEAAKLGGLAKDLDMKTGGQISRAMKTAEFSGKKESFLEILAPNGVKLSKIILAGIGKPKNVSQTDAENLGGLIGAKLLSGNDKNATILIEELKGADDKTIASHLAFGFRLRNYEFKKYLSKKNDPPKLNSVTISSEETSGATRLFKSLEKIGQGVFMARDLVNEPANILTPAEFMKRAKTLSKLGVKIKVLDEAQMKKLKMNSLLSVGVGSVNKSYLVVMEWNGGKKSEKPATFVGKGVTFDTGGISIKPSAGMGDMKGDMGGAACVTGLMCALAGRKAKANVVGIIGLVENMPDAAAQRPGDIVTSASGQTIEVLNTDAEGRLVLADALWYAQKFYKPKFMIDLATLTGAILVALGQEHAGIFGNDDKLCEQLRTSGEVTGEKVWRLPLGSAYDKMIDSPIADMKNIGGRYAGSITAAQFLKRFVDKDIPWVHIDVAGTAMNSPKTAVNQSWGSGFGVRLLNRLVADNHE